MKKFEWMSTKDSVAEGCEVRRNFYPYNANYELIIIINTKNHKKVSFLASRDMPEEELNDIIECMGMNLI